MSGYIGNAADAAQQIADDYIGNGVFAVRYAMQHSYGRVSCTHCKDCGEEIPEARRQAVPGVKFCIECQDDHMVVRKVRMLTKML